MGAGAAPGEAGAMEHHMRRRSRTKGWLEGVFLAVTASCVVLAVLRPDLYGGLVQHFAATVSHWVH